LVARLPQPLQEPDERAVEGLLGLEVHDVARPGEDDPLRLRDARRHQLRGPVVALVELAGSGPRADDVAHARRVGASLEAELAALPDRQREALWLAAVEGFSYAEVASTLATSESSVKALVHRARATLAERLGPERTQP